MQVQAISLAIGVVLPILVGIVTTRATDEALKAVLLALASAISGFLTELLNTPHFHWEGALLTWLGTFAVAVASHFGWWKPTGVSQYVQANVGVTAAPKPASVPQHGAGQP